MRIPIEKFSRDDTSVFRFLSVEVMSSRRDSNRSLVENDRKVSETEEHACTELCLAYEDWILKRPDGTHCSVPSTEQVDGINATLNCLLAAKPRCRKSGKSTRRL